MRNRPKIYKLVIGLALTWCHCSPANAPTRLSTLAICNEYKLDDVACACDGGGQVGANHIPARRAGVKTAAAPEAALKGGVLRESATAFLHQSCPVTVCDCQVVAAIGTMIVVDIKCSEFQENFHSLLHLYLLNLLKVVGILVGVVWRGDYTCGLGV